MSHEELPCNSSARLPDRGDFRLRVSRPVGNWRSTCNLARVGTSNRGERAVRLGSFAWRHSVLHLGNARRYDFAPLAHVSGDCSWSSGDDRFSVSDLSRSCANVRRLRHNKMVDQTGRDAAQYLLIVWAASHSLLR